MLASEPRLPILAERFLKINYLSTTPGFLPFHPESNQLVPHKIFQKDPDTIPFRCVLKNSWLYDGFYCVKANVQVQGVPNHCLVKVLWWSLELKNGELLMSVKKASVEGDPPEIPQHTTHVESSPLVAPLLHTIRHRNASRSEPPYMPPLNSFQESLSPPKLASQPIPDVGFNPRPRQPEFREPRQLELNSQEDIVSAIQTPEELSIQVFPKWAIDFLRYHYQC
mmetsp:Transcript_4695/g.7069  ORF Transcript_4695/g.7069 Transcript_4695/m.7069 type:complete len:224 (+) Transcript_4695:2-673(+)